MKKVLNTDVKADELTEHLAIIEDESNFIFDGQRHSLIGNNNAVHLVKIDNSNGIIKNLNFIGGNTYLLRSLPRKDIKFKKKPTSVFEYIDGGAVVVTGNSAVTFIDCYFTDNQSVMCGGAVSNQSTGLLKFVNCTFKNNRAGHTGAAIDNLVKGSRIVVDNCKFIDNISNTWNKHGFPHGHISLFPFTKATIKNSTFLGGSIPFDYYDKSRIVLKSNSYQEYKGWSEHEPQKRSYRFFNDKVDLILQFSWLIPKTIGNVVYAVNPQ